MDDVELRVAEEDAREEHDRTLAERDRVGDMTPAGDAALFGGLSMGRPPKVASVAVCREHGLHGGCACVAQELEFAASALEATVR
jgi:hypothetical protein